MATDTRDNSAGLLPLLSRSVLCHGLAQPEIETIAAAADIATFASGETICRQDEHGDRMYIVAKGRVKLTLDKGGQQFQLLEYLSRGQHFGEMAVLTDGGHTATAVAVMDTELLVLDHPNFQRLMIQVPGFAANLSRTLGFRMRKQSSGRRLRQRPKIIGLVNSTLRTQALLRPLVQELVAQGCSIEVLTDRSEKWPSGGDYPVELIPADLPESEKPALVRERLAHVAEHHDHVFLDVAQRGLEGQLPLLLLQCEEVWWLIEAGQVEAARRNLVTLLAAEPRLAGRVRIVWILSEQETYSPPPLEGLPIDGLDFKVPLAADPASNWRNQRMGIARLVRHLRGTRIGLAMGGGGARGLAHLGVLRGLEREGICFDFVAGTSCGALMGLSYVTGMAPQEAVDKFHAALTPHRMWRMLPAGNFWYLMYKFRSGAWNRMLRPFLGDARLEQFQIPFCTVSSDLVAGQPTVRDSGDAIHAVLESINIPGLSRPMLRDGMALVDGGVLNNLPSDALVNRGLDLIVGIDVVAKLRHEFAGNRPSTPTPQMRRAGIVKTLWRVTEVHDHAYSSLRTGEVDLMITPDTADFDFTDFSQGPPLADAGEAAALDSAPQIKQLLSDLQKNP